MRARLLLLVSLLILVGGVAVWFAGRAQSGQALTPIKDLAPKPVPALGGEPLDPVAEDAATAVDPSRVRGLVPGEADGAQGISSSKSAVSVLRGLVLAEDDTPVEEFDLVLSRNGILSSEPTISR